MFVKAKRSSLFETKHDFFCQKASRIFPQKNKKKVFETKKALNGNDSIEEGYRDQPMGTVLSITFR
jgi:hypothetical protein